MVLDQRRPWPSATSRAASGTALPGGAVVGPQGHGKSLTAKAMPTAGRWPCCGWMWGGCLAGSGGRRAKRAPAHDPRAEADWHPACFWIDEIDKGFGATAAARGSRRDGAGQALLNWMGREDHGGVRGGHGPTGSGQNLPPEADGGKGRFDEIFLLDLPDAGPDGRTILDLQLPPAPSAMRSPSEVLSGSQRWLLRRSELEATVGRP